MNRYAMDNGNTELRFLIPSKAAGVIIGKGGENVKDLREKYEIKVNIPDSPGPERVLHVIGAAGPVIEAIEATLEKLQDSIPASESEIYADASMRHRNRTPRRSRSQKDEEDGRGDEPAATISGIDFRMLIHQSQAGGIIGRGGEQIKELREKADLRTLKVYQTMCPMSSDRVIQMVGDVDKVVLCIRSISDKLLTIPSRGAEQPYDARNYDESQALNYGGWLSKASQKAVQEYGVHALLGMGVPPGGHMNAVAGNPNAMAAIAAARANMIGQQVPTSNHGANMHQHPAMAAAAANPMMMMSMMMSPVLSGAPDNHRRGGNPPPPHMPIDRAVAMDGATKTMQVSVPNSYMGSIMGRGGARIRSIREESGADIRVHEPDGGDRIIDITGSPTQISYAQQLLKSCVLLYHEKK